MNYKVEAWSWCADYCKKNQWNPHDSYFWNKALLEYRRQHNIFEVGDKVVHIYDSGNSMLFTVKDITDHGYSFGNDWGWRGVISNMGVGHAFRHATTKEIKAGKRLEVS